MLDVAIIGGGPAGLTASIYASRYKLKHQVFASEIGGYLNEIHKIENYPGLLGISGVELAQKFSSHVKDLGGEIVTEEIVKIEKENNHFQLTTGNQNQIKAKMVIFAGGTKARKMNVPGEEQFLGKGVSYCATCDAPFFKDKNVIVIGGGNSAAVASLILSQHASLVKLFYRGEELKCAPAFIEQMESNPKIEIFCCTTLEEIKGDSIVREVIIKEGGKTKTIKTDGVFIEIGSDPNLEPISNLKIETDSKGYIKTNPDQSTSVEGFYAAGDITTNSNGFRQIITAAAEGAIATLSVFEKLKKNGSQRT